MTFYKTVGKPTHFNPAFAYVNACWKMPLQINLTYLDNKKIYCILKTCSTICFIFHKCH